MLAPVSLAGNIKDFAMKSKSPKNQKKEPISVQAEDSPVNETFAPKEGAPENASGSQDSVPGVASVEDKEVVCPSCFRFTGTYEKCPYCGAQVYKRLSVRFFRWGSLIFAIVGIILLWAAARGIKAPVVKINTLEPSMSMGFVRVVGKITNEPALHPEWKSLYLRVTDGSGEVSVNAFSEVAVKVLDKMTLSMGDEISVQGMVRFRGKVPKPSLLLQSPDHISIVKKAPPRKIVKPVPMKIGAVKPELKGKKVLLTGVLEKSEVLGFGAYRGVLVQDGASIIVWVSPNKWKTFLPEAKPLLKAGTAMTVRGYVETYFDKAEQKTVLEVIPDGYDGCIAVQSPSSEESSEREATPETENSGDSPESADGTADSSSDEGGSSESTESGSATGGE